MRSVFMRLGVIALGLASFLASFLAGGSLGATAELRDPLDSAVLLATGNRVEPNITYLSVGGWDGKLDLYLPRRPSGALPTALLFHGGGWVTGDKNEVALDVLPYLEMGFAVVNVDYRLARIARAPAAVEDSRCALRWVIRHAAQFGFDTRRLVLVGSSAGAHLALMAALAPASAGFDGLCPGNETLKAAAVINFFGVADVAQLLVPPRPRDFAVGWLGNGPRRDELARRVSPLTYVDKNAPAVLTLHGDADPVVPFEQATRLHAALDRAGAPNRLVPIPGGRHGDFGGREVLRSTRAVREFLVQQKIIAPQPPAPKRSPQAEATDRP